MKTRHLRAAVALAAAGAASLVLAACASAGPGADPGSGGATSPSSSSSALSSRADLQFTQMMIVHHEGALEMAALAASRAGSPEVRDLAARIEAAQQPEIDLMTGWLQAWGEEPLDDDGAMPGMDHGDMSMGGTGGMASDDELASLEELSGPRFDELFLELMITHHEGAVMMSRMEAAHGQDPEVVALAERIITSQTAEIAEMEAMLAGDEG